MFRFISFLALANLAVAGCGHHLSMPVNAVVSDPNSEETKSLVTVRVVDRVDEAAIAGVLLTTGSYNTIPDNVLGKTDDTGRWRGVLRCTYVWPDQDTNEDDLGFSVKMSTITDWLWVTGEGYVPQRIDVSEFRKGNAPDRPIVVRATRGNLLRGCVTMQDGEKPVSNEPILLVAASEQYPIQFETVTDSAGRFEWRGFPGGELSLGLGIAGKDSTPFFRRYKPLDGNIVVSVPGNWQSRVFGDERHLLYVEHKDGIAVLPATLQSLTLPGELDPIFSLPDELSVHGNSSPVRDLVLSLPAKGDRFYFFALRGNHGDVRSSGELRIGKVEVTEEFQRMMNDRRSEHPEDSK